MRAWAPTNMTLADIIANLEAIDNSLCIVARRPWTPQAEAKAIELNDGSRIPDDVLSDRYEYFLEVSIARDDVIGELRSLSVNQRVEACIFYAENDAYPEWLSKLR